MFQTRTCYLLIDWLYCANGACPGTTGNPHCQNTMLIVPCWCNKSLLSPTDSMLTMDLEWTQTLDWLLGNMDNVYWYTVQDKPFSFLHTYMYIVCMQYIYLEITVLCHNKLNRHPEYHNGWWMEFLTSTWQFVNTRNILYIGFIYSKVKCMH